MTTMYVTEQGAVPVAGPADEGDVACLSPVCRFHGLERKRASAQDDDILSAPSLNNYDSMAAPGKHGTDACEHRRAPQKQPVDAHACMQNIVASCHSMPTCLQLCKQPLHAVRMERTGSIHHRRRNSTSSTLYCSRAASPRMQSAPARLVANTTSPAKPARPGTPRTSAGTCSPATSCTLAWHASQA